MFYSAKSKTKENLVKTYLILLLTALLLAPINFSFGADSASASASKAEKELGALIQKIQTKLQAGKKTEADLAPELKEFDTLLAQYKGEQSDEVAQILFMKAILYVQIFDDSDKATVLLKQLQKDFPKTKQGKQVDEILANFERQKEAEKIRRALVVGSKFPDFNEKDVNGKPISVANHKGKVVLVDFWATWCGPCVRELPTVLEAYRKHHANGFEIVGISLDQSMEKLKDFTKEQGMTWQQFFDGKVWQNKLAQQYGVNSIPATYLLDKDGVIIGKDLRGPELDKALVEALAKK